MGKQILDWGTCSESGNVRANYGTHTFWIFESQHGAELSQVNFYGDEKPMGIFKDAEAAKNAAETSVRNHP